MAGIKFDILGNNNPALKALAELRESLAKVNASFKETKKNAGSGSGGAFDPKEINSIGEQLKGVNGIIKNMSMSSNQWNRGSGAKELKTGFDGVTQAAKGLYGVVSGLFPVMAGLTGYGVVRGLANLASGFGSAATNVQKVNYETGLPKQTIQKYENRFMEYGISKKDTDEGLNNFFQKMRLCG